MRGTRPSGPSHSLCRAGTRIRVRVLYAPARPSWRARQGPWPPLFKVPQTPPWIPSSSRRPLQQTLAPPPLELRSSSDSTRSHRSATSTRRPSVPEAPPRDKKQPDSSSPLSRASSPRQSLTVAPLRCLATEHAPSRVYSPPEPRQRVRQRASVLPVQKPEPNHAQAAATVRSRSNSLDRIQTESTRPDTGQP